ncbi:MAG: class I SAM-dependent methyltransferase, partial [Acidobacteriota bacterium]|nr:class I SAM-dependent methyltransferase [Acidobacteriota bacterium]
AKAVRLNLEAKIKFSRMDAEALEFDAQTFDKVVSLFALLHFPNPQTALKEIFRVMRPGGKLVLAVGSSPPFSLSGLVHRAKHLSDFVQRLRGKQLVAPFFLDSMVEENLPKIGEAEESHLAHHSHNRTQPVAELIKQAGFEILKTDWSGDMEIVETPEEFWEIQRTFSSIARKLINDAAPEKSELLYNQFLEKCRWVQASGGKLVYPFGAFYVVARKPQ